MKTYDKNYIKYIENRERYIWYNKTDETFKLVEYQRWGSPLKTIKNEESKQRTIL